MDSPTYLEPLDPADPLIQEICYHLSTFKIQQVSGGSGRSRTFGKHRAITLGMIRSRRTKQYGLSAYSKKYPELYAALQQLADKICPFKTNAIHINNNVVCPRHCDSGNTGASVIFSIGDYEGCKLVIEGHGTFDTNCHPVVFDGSKLFHWNTPLESGNKYSFVFFTNSST